MSKQTWTELLVTDGANNGATFSNTTTETILFPDYTIPGGYMNDGRILRYTALGKISATSTPTFTIKLRMGGVSGTLIAQSSAITLAAATDSMFEIMIIIESRGNGTSSPILAMGRVMWAVTIKTTNTPDFIGSAGGASTNTPATVNVDTTQNQALSLTGTWGTANSSNSVTGMQRTIESLN